MIRAYIIIAAAIALAAGVWYIRHDAAMSERARIEAEQAQTTIEALRQSQKDREDAKDLDDDGLINALGRWLLPAP